MVVLNLRVRQEIYFYSQSGWETKRYLFGGEIRDWHRKWRIRCLILSQQVGALQTH